MFGSTFSDHVQEFVSQKKKKFAMSMVCELTYFLGLQVKPIENEIFIKVNFPRTQLRGLA